MEKVPIVIGLSWQLFSGLLLFLALVAAIRRLPLRTLIAEPRLQHLFFGALVLLTLAWSFRAGISEGLSIHFLGMTTLTLMFGWNLALLAGCLGYLALTLLGAESWNMLAVNILAMVFIPASATLLMLRLVERRLQPNFFIYLFVVAFLGGGVAAALGGLSLALILGLDGVHSWSKIYNEYVLYLPLIMFPEGLINGIIMTGMMVFYPDWIRTFNAKRYIDEQ